MIWIEFRRGTPGIGKPSSIFLGEGEKIWIEVRTDPQVEDLSITGKVQLVGSTDHPETLTFQGNAAPFTPSEEGTYRVEVTAKAENYRPSRLSATFYYRKEEPTISEFDHP